MACLGATWSYGKLLGFWHFATTSGSKRIPLAARQEINIVNLGGPQHQQVTVFVFEWTAQ
jgi:hypothetical protein